MHGETVQLPFFKGGCFLDFAASQRGDGRMVLLVASGRAREWKGMHAYMIFDLLNTYLHLMVVDSSQVKLHLSVFLGSSTIGGEGT